MGHMRATSIATTVYDAKVFWDAIFKKILAAMPRSYYTVVLGPKTTRCYARMTPYFMVH
jgi:hypothetical protein